MGDRKFVPQSILDLWADLGKIGLEGTTLKIPAEGVEFELTPAIRFVSLLEGQDSHQLLAKVKSSLFVKELGGEVLDDSCLIDDTAYEVQPGFLAETQALAAAQVAKATRPPPARRSASAAGEAKASPAAAPAKPPPPQAKAPESEKEPQSQKAPQSEKAPESDEEAKRDAELLSQFLLQHLE